MLQDYQQQGVTLRYPAGWEVSEDQSDQQRMITLQTAGASFWTLTVFDDRPDPERILASVLQAFRDDYEEIDVYPIQATVLQQPATGADLDFVYLDLVNSVSIRTFQTDDLSALVLYQGPDYELEALRPQFEAVTESLAFEDAEETA